MSGVDGTEEGEESAVCRGTWREEPGMRVDTYAGLYASLEIAVAGDTLARWDWLTAVGDWGVADGGGYEDPRVWVGVAMWTGEAGAAFALPSTLELSLTIEWKGRPSRICIPDGVERMLSESGGPDWNGMGKRSSTQCTIAASAHRS